MPVVIGLTGSIACGKSTVGQMLTRLGAEVIDADLVSHGLMARGSSVWQRVVQEFGRGILTPEGEIDRAALGDAVFENPVALARLEQITHPAVKSAVRRLIAQSKAAVVVVEAVKLLESGLLPDCDSVWVVKCPREQQLTRLMEVRGLSQEVAEARLKSQPKLENQLRQADVVIDSSGSMDNTWRQVQAGWQKIAVMLPHGQ